MALTRDEAVKILINRYEIGKREAEQNWEAHLTDLKVHATDAFGKRIPNSKAHFTDKKEYLSYLNMLENE